jgi:serine/threonine-protein kinase RsbW
MGAGTSVVLVIPSEVRLIDLVHAASEKMAEIVGFDEDEALNVGLAVREAVINAMLHGNQQDPALEVRITLTGEGDRLTATVADQGSGFEPGATPDPLAAANQLKESGRGLLLIQAFVDEVEFRNPPEGGTEIRMVKRVPAAAGDDDDDDDDDAKDS